MAPLNKLRGRSAGTEASRSEAPADGPRRASFQPFVWHLVVTLVPSLGVAIPLGSAVGAFWPGGPRRSEDAPSEGVEGAGGLCGPGGKGNGQLPSDKGSVLRKENTFPGSAREEGSVRPPSHARVG